MIDDDSNWTFGDGGFAKLYGDRLTRSSLLDRDVATRWCFVWMLSQADEHGRFRCASTAGLARSAAVTLEQAERAVVDLEGPDPDSTTPDHDGRRIERIPGGWRVLNYARYREFRTARQVAEAARKRNWRGSKSAPERETAGHVPGRPRDVPGTSAPDVRRQTSEDRLTDTETTTSRATWLTPYGVAWKDALGGEPSWRQLAKELKPLHDRFGVEVLLAGWIRYLRETEKRYASPNAFAKRVGAWVKIPSKPKAKPPALPAPDPATAQRWAAARDSVEMPPHLKRTWLFPLRALCVTDDAAFVLAAPSVAHAEAVERYRTRIVIAMNAAPGPEIRGVRALLDEADSELHNGGL